MLPIHGRRQRLLIDGFSRRTAHTVLRTAAAFLLHASVTVLVQLLVKPAVQRSPFEGRGKQIVMVRYEGSGENVADLVFYPRRKGFTHDLSDLLCLVPGTS